MSLHTEKIHHFLYQCVQSTEYLSYQYTLFKTGFDKKIAWLKSFDSKILPWSSYHLNNSTCSNSDCVPGRHSLMLLINEKVNTLKSQFHCIGIIKTIISLTKVKYPLTLQINHCMPFRKKYRYGTHQNLDQKNTHVH